MKKYFLFLLFVYACNGIYASGKLVIADQGKSEYQIVVPFKGSDNDMRAAEILQSYLFKISGFMLPVATDNEPRRDKEIVIGHTNRMKERAWQRLTKGLAPDGYVIRTSRSKLFIAGGSHKGSIYGVVTILEKYLGCRKYSPTVEYVPPLKTIALDPVNLRDQPVNSFRVVYGNFSRNQDYKDWQRLDEISDLFPNEYYVHTLGRTILPQEQYFSEHPEYFALMNGKRVPDQLCLSNPEVLRLTIEKLKQEMALHPDKQYWSVSQNDNFSYCHCPECMKAIEEEGSPSGPIIRFVNKVAEQFPDKVISTLAYQYSRPAPKLTRPAQNVQIMLCTIEVNRSKPIATDSTSQSFVKDITDWGKISNHIYLWDYTVNFSHHVTPFPNLHVLQPNIQFFVRNKAYEHFQQSNTDNGHEFSELKNYLLARLLWNPDINVDSVMTDFLNGYYGNAGPWIRKYIDRMQGEVIRTGEWLDIYDSPVAHTNTFLSAENTALYNEYFDQALAAVKANEPVYERVKTARLPLEYALMEIGKNDMFGPRGWYVQNGKAFILKQAMKDMLEDFYATCMKNGVKTLSEAGLTPDDYYHSVLRFIDVQIENNLAFRKKVTINPMPSAKYSGGDPAVLTNGVQGATDFKVHWLGWQGEDAGITVDLDTLVSPHRISIGMLSDPRSWILFPTGITCQVSEDGRQFRTVGIQTVEGDQLKKEGPRTFVFDKDLGRFQYVRLLFTGTHTLPSWHTSAGEKSWMFADEIAVQ